MKISYNNLRDQAINLVVEKGEDYIGFPGAYFRPDGAPGCLLGEVIANKGVTMHDLSLRGINRGGVGDLKMYGYLVPEDGATHTALVRLQNFNDRGQTWFAAVCFAFGMSENELREEIKHRRSPQVQQFNAEAYVDWVSSYSEGAEKPVIDMSLPVHAPVAPHVLAA